MLQQGPQAMVEMMHLPAAQSGAWPYRVSAGACSCQCTVNG